MRRALLGAALLALALAPPAGAVELEGYAGGSPFRCELQQAGLGTDIPNPDADPLCVEYDKTQQNVDQLGLVRFLAGEPARFGYAGDKCFYVQRDHWRGSLAQDDEQSETYNWDGWYFWDRAKGVAGAFVENFTVNNASGDPTAMPGFPAEWKPYFGHGRGGMLARDAFPPEPRCVEKAEREDPYARPAAPPAAVPPERPALAPPRPRLSLRLRCRRGHMGARVVGRDARHARRVRFRTGRRTLARDSRRPWARRVSRRKVRRARRVTAQVVMRDGRRVTLRRRLPRSCR
jgi:hypothetical protein